MLFYKLLNPDDGLSSCLTSSFSPTKSHPLTFSLSHFLTHLFLLQPSLQNGIADDVYARAHI